MELNTILYFIFGGVIAFFILQKIIGAFSKKDNTSGNSSKKSKKNLPKEHVLICGPSGSGKTCLLNSLALNEFRDTVTSIEENGA